MPTSKVFQTINLYLRNSLLIAALFGQISFAHADDFNVSSSNNAVSQSPSNVDTPKLVDDEFLPVEEAFKVSGAISKDATGIETLRLTWVPAPGYYLYKERFKFSVVPIFPLKPVYSEGTEKFDEFFGENTVVYHEPMTIDFVLPAKTSAFDLNIKFQGCADAGLCYPPTPKTLRIDPTKGSTETLETTEEEIFADATPQEAEPASQIFFWQAVIFAMLGGMILNLMPCVFPVLSIKVMSLVQADSKRLRIHGWAYTLGIIVCFVGFAVALLIARKGGEAIGWGFQLQSPGLVTALCYLFFVMGLSMSGMIHFGARWMGAGQSLTQKSGLSGSFFTGVLAAIVASPCAAPFMATALGFALTQPPLGCLSIFTALGFGMALPLLLLCYIPSLAERLPKPGVWMENLKEFLAFPLYLAAVWLLWVLGHQSGVDLMTTVCAGAVAIAFACWLLGRQSTSWQLRFNQLLIVVCLAIAVILPWQMLNKTEESSRWQPYSAEAVEELRAQGRPVFVDFTAAWCLTCLANERATLGKANVEAVFDEYQVATLKGDWTNRDPKITAVLKEYRRSGVPLYLWFPANRPGKADVLPQILTPSMVISKIKGEK